MHDHRSAVAPPGTTAHEHQRRLILELAIEPRQDGESPEDMARVLGLSVAAIDAAADALVAAGLAERRCGRLRPSYATLALDALWPLAM